MSGTAKACEHCRSETRVLVDRAYRLGTVNVDPAWPQRGASPQLAMRRTEAGDDLPMCEACQARMHKAILSRQRLERLGAYS